MAVRCARPAPRPSRRSPRKYRIAPFIFACSQARVHPQESSMNQSTEASSPRSTDTSRAIRGAVWAALVSLVGACATAGGGASGSDEQPTSAEKQAMTSVGGKANGRIVWSSSRLGNHDLFVMNTDGSNVHAITKGDAVDWFPRFSPDGSRILFTRSKKGWVYERDANSDGKWDIYTVTPDGKEETKVVDNASWGGWIGADEIVYVRSTAVFRRALAGGTETLLVDSTKVPALDGSLLQQPELSKDGAYLAITL